MSDSIRTDKKILLAKMLVMTEILNICDVYFGFKDKITSIARDAELDDDYLIEWAKTELDSYCGIDE